MSLKPMNAQRQTPSCMTASWPARLPPASSPNCGRRLRSGIQGQQDFKIRSEVPVRMANEIPRHKHFVDWYRVAQIDPSKTALDARWAGITQLIADPPASRTVDLVRAAHQQLDGRPKLLDEFRELFQATDPTFEMRGNDYEVAVLVAISLLQLLESQPSSAGDLAALAIASAEFNGWTPVLSELAA